MKLTIFAGLIALITTMTAFSGCASSYYIIGPYTVTFAGIEEYKTAIPESGPTLKTDSGISYTGYSRTFLKENDKGSMTIGIYNYADQMYKDDQDPRDALKSLEALKSLIQPNDKTTIENIKTNGKPGILIKKKGTWASGEPSISYFIYYWLDPKTIVSAYFIESPTDKWEDTKKSMMSIDVSRYLPS